MEQRGCALAAPWSVDLKEHVGGGMEGEGLDCGTDKADNLRSRGGGAGAAWVEERGGALWTWGGEVVPSGLGVVRAGEGKRLDG